LIDQPVLTKGNAAFIVMELGERQVWLCGLVQYGNLVGTAIGYTITSSISMVYVLPISLSNQLEAVHEFMYI
jgi:hypothetical protein